MTRPDRFARHLWAGAALAAFAIALALGLFNSHAEPGERNNADAGANPVPHLVAITLA